MTKNFSKKKTNKVWNKLFSPPCPKCGSTKTKEELRDIPVIANGIEMFEALINQHKGLPNKPIRTWECLDCGTVFDEKGRSIRYGS